MFIGEKEKRKLEIIKEAILSKKSISCIYNKKVRHLSPHAVGEKLKEGKIILNLLSIQYDGDSSYGLSIFMEHNWRLMHVSKIEDLRINSDFFVTATNHTQKSNGFDKIIYEIKY